MVFKAQLAVFKAQLSGAKFYVVEELRAPCDLGLSVDPGTYL